MARKAWICGREDIIAWYDDNAPDDMPYFSVWKGKMILFSFDGQSKADGVDLLEKNLIVAEGRGISDILLIKLHKNLTATGLNEKTPCWAAMEVQVCEAPDTTPTYANMAYTSMGEVKKLQERLDALEGGGGATGIMGSINNLLASEHMAPVIGQVAVGIINKFLPGILGPVPQPAPDMGRIGAVEQDSYPVTKELYDTLMGLQQVDPQICDDLVLLLKLARKNPVLFNTLLTNLRSL
jgi:hypothetical protein